MPTELIKKHELNNGVKNALDKIEHQISIYNHKYLSVLKASYLDSPLGPLLAVSDDETLYLLEFIDRQNLDRKIEKLQIKMKSAIIFEKNPPIESITQELQSYFDGTLKEFKTPFCFSGSSFQILTWNALRQIPYGQTRSYKDQAFFIKNPSAYRAVASANGANQLAIIIPCHRIINHDGGLGGYGGGCTRKKWLIDHERNNCYQFAQS